MNGRQYNIRFWILVTLLVAAVAILSRNKIKTMKRNHNYKGGTISEHGYRLQYVGKDHHLADVRGYAYEHRIEAEKKLGRRLRKGEQVHHDDENKLNNEHDNLIVTRSIVHHRALHRKIKSDNKLPGQRNRTISCACGCGGRFKKFDGSNRPRKYISGHNPRKNVAHINGRFTSLKNLPA